MSYTAIRKFTEFVTPALTKSHFLESGVLTPEEFVKAGDYLIAKFPTWEWASGDPSMIRSILPPNKQFLVTKGVPCQTRARNMFGVTTEKSVGDGLGGGEEDSWTYTETTGTGSGNQDDIPDIVNNSNSNSNSNSQKISAKPAAAAAPQDNDDDDDDIPDITDDIDDNVLVDDDESTVQPASAAAAKESEDDGIFKTRKYDINITYDKYYQTPRVWLFGYDENGNPLSKKQVYEDISQEHADKTCTVETHPHFNAECACIHPCRHAPMMKRLLDMRVEAGKKIEVEQYLFFFLKFISSVIPTIQYDFTTDAD